MTGIKNCTECGFAFWVPGCTPTDRTKCAICEAGGIENIVIEYLPISEPIEDVIEDTRQVQLQLI